MQHYELMKMLKQLLERNPVQAQRFLMAACDGLGAGFFEGCWPHLSVH